LSEFGCYGDFGDEVFIKYILCHQLTSFFFKYDKDNNIKTSDIISLQDLFISIISSIWYGQTRQ